MNPTAYTAQGEVSVWQLVQVLNNPRRGHFRIGGPLEKLFERNLEAPPWSQGYKSGTKLDLYTYHLFRGVDLGK